jgi:hypothetical protein
MGLISLPMVYISFISHVVHFFSHSLYLYYVLCLRHWGSLLHYQEIIVNFSKGLITIFYFDEGRLINGFFI